MEGGLRKGRGWNLRLEEGWRKGGLWVEGESRTGEEEGENNLGKLSENVLCIETFL